MFRELLRHLGYGLGWVRDHAKEPHWPAPAGRLLLLDHAGAPSFAHHFAHGRESDVYS
jgi:hypothetical protein